jgi:hypothetical protein
LTERKPPPDGRGQRPLQREPRAPDAVEQWPAAADRRTQLDARFQAGNLAIPNKGRLKGVQRGQGGVDDFLTDPVTGDQGGRNAGGGVRLGHGSGSCLGTADRRPSLPS